MVDLRCEKKRRRKQLKKFFKRRSVSEKNILRKRKREGKKTLQGSVLKSIQDNNHPSAPHRVVVTFNKKEKLCHVRGLETAERC